MQPKHPQNVEYFSKINTKGRSTFQQNNNKKQWKEERFNFRFVFRIYIFSIFLGFGFLILILILLLEKFVAENHDLEPWSDGIGVMNKYESFCS